MSSPISPNQKSLRRFRKNRPAVIGLVWIGCSILVAILGYLISPDQSPDANEQNTEVSLAPVGYHTNMLAICKNKQLESTSIFQTMLFGKVNPCDLLAIKNYQIKDDSLIAYSVGGDTTCYHLANIAFSLSLKNSNINIQAGNVFFNDITERVRSISQSDLRQKVINEHIYSKTFYLGTDKFGRCMLSRLIIGVRISLLVGLIAVIISLLLGISLGALAGYLGGRVDDIISLFMNVIWSIPTVLLVFAIVLALGRGIGNIFFAVGLTMWVDVARMVRGQVMAMRDLQFIEATKSFGYTTFRIIFIHILPNILGPVMVIAASNFATAILLEAGLSYLGFGIRPPMPSWGTMLNETYGYAVSGKPILAMIPAFAIMLLVLAFNLLGNGIRDALDVKSKL